MTRHETIVCMVRLDGFRRSRNGKAWIASRVATIDVGDQAELIVRYADGKCWIVHSGRTPLCAYSSSSAIGRQVQAALGDTLTADEIWIDVEPQS